MTNPTDETICQGFRIDPNTRTIRWHSFYWCALPAILGTRDPTIARLNLECDIKGMLIVNGTPDSIDLTAVEYFTIAGDPRAFPGPGMYVGEDRTRIPGIQVEDFERRVQWLTAHDILKLVTRL